ncbi:MAG TPA: hypothetical protein PKY73_17500 [Hyphomonas sp.]|nr:hypothetical protein [Hyphomonas sp.]
MKKRFFARSAARILGLSILACGITSLIPANAYACSRIPMTLEQASFRHAIDTADRIVLATTTGQRLATMEEFPGVEHIPIPIHQYSFSVNEVLKGEVGSEITAFGTTQDFAKPRTAERHRFPGPFWAFLWDHPMGNIYCGHIPSFEISKTYLLFLNEHGAPQKSFYLGYEEISGPDDPWLLAVRELAGDPERRMVGQASIVDFMRGADRIDIVESAECPAQEEGNFKLVENLWSRSAEQQLVRNFGTFLPAKVTCTVGKRWLQILYQFHQEYTWLIGVALPVTDDTVDFSQLWPDSDKGSVGDQFFRLNAQFEREGPVELTLAEIREGLKPPQLPE